MRRNTRDIIEVLVNNIEENIDINIQKNKKFKIQIKNMSFFIIKKIEMY